MDSLSAFSIRRSASPRVAPFSISRLTALSMPLAMSCWYLDSIFATKVFAMPTMFHILDVIASVPGSVQLTLQRDHRGYRACRRQVRHLQQQRGERQGQL